MIDSIKQRWHTWIAVAYFLWALAISCHAQDDRWRLIQPVQRDSIVAVPLDDLRKAAGFRIAKNTSQRQCAWELAQRAKELDSARRTIEAKNETIFKKDEAITRLRSENEAVMDRARKAERKLRNRKPWMYFLFGALTTGTVIAIAK